MVLIYGYDVRDRHAGMDLLQTHFMTHYTACIYSVYIMIYSVYMHTDLLTAMSWRMLVSDWRCSSILIKFLMSSSSFTAIKSSFSWIKYFPLNKDFCNWYLIAIAVVNILHV